MANKTVKDFEFPSSFGFTGSGGKTVVKSYTRKAKNDLTPRSNLPQYNAVEQRSLSKPMTEINRAADRGAIRESGYKKGGAVRPAKGKKMAMGGPVLGGPNINPGMPATALPGTQTTGMPPGYLEGAGNIKALPGAMPSPPPGKDVIGGALGGLQRRPANLPAMIRSRMGARGKDGLRPAGVPPYSGMPMIGGMKKGGKVKC